MKLFGYVLIKEDQLEAKEREHRNAEDGLRKEIATLKRLKSSMDMFRTAQESGQIKLISSLNEELQTVKQKYADELQKRLALAEMVREMEENAK